jgi:beta-glucanase (GH16 family)
MPSYLACFVAITLVCQTAAAASGLAEPDAPTLSAPNTATPTITTKNALNGARIVSLATSTTGATIHFTLDGSEPTPGSPLYNTPLLVASDLTIKAYATLIGYLDSSVATFKFALPIVSGTLVWSDEFNNTTGRDQQPDPDIWTYETGSGGFGNHELETYCAWASTTSPCDPAHPNAFVGTDGSLHIVARQPSPGVYTSARINTQGLLSMQYGRLEARIMAPEAQGLWPAFWTLGSNIKSVDWPACGEQDIMERVNAALSPDWNEGSIHGPGFTGTAGLGTRYSFPPGQNASQWHTYGITWKKDSVAFYVDDPNRPYVTYTNPSGLAKLQSAKWPFDSGNGVFLLLNLAVGGDWPGPPDQTTSFPSSLLIDYVRIYSN